VVDVVLRRQVIEAVEVPFVDDLLDERTGCSAILFLDRLLVSHDSTVSHPNEQV
jgi:hypothetical protein